MNGGAVSSDRSRGVAGRAPAERAAAERTAAGRAAAGRGPRAAATLLLAGVAVLLSAAALPGCNIVTPVVTILAGPPSKDAEYKLEDRLTVVYVDDRMGRIPLRSSQVRGQLATRLTEILNTNKKLIPGSAMSPRDANAIADQLDRAGELVPLGTIGENVGAEVVIGIEILRFGFGTGGVPRPTSSVGVKILDITAKERVYPSPEEPFRVVEADMLEIDQGRLASESGRIQVLLALADQTAVEVAKLFYKHEIKELGGNLEAPD